MLIYWVHSFMLKQTPYNYILGGVQRSLHWRLEHEYQSIPKAASQDSWPIFSHVRSKTGMQSIYSSTSITDNINRKMQSRWFSFILRWKPSAQQEVLLAWSTSSCNHSSPRDLCYFKRSNSISITKMMPAYMLTEWRTWPVLSQSQSE